MTRRFWIGRCSAPRSFWSRWRTWSRRRLTMSAGSLDQLDGSRALDAGRVLGGLAIFERAWASIVNRSPNMFTLIATGRRRRLSVQRARHDRARRSFQQVSRMHGVVADLLRHRRSSSPSWSCSARCSSCGRAARRAAQSSSSWAWRRRRLARRSGDGHSDDATSRSATSWWAISAASGRAKACRSTEWSSTGDSAIDESMVTGEPMPVGKAAGAPRHRRHDQHDRALASCGRSGSEPTRCSRRSSRMVGDAQRSRAPIQRLADGSLRISSRRSCWWRCLAFHRLEHLGTAAASGAGAGERGGRADHRVSVRARPGDANGHHGRHRPRGDGGRARQACGSARTPRAGGHAGRSTRPGTLTEGKPPNSPQSWSRTVARAMKSFASPARAGAVERASACGAIVAAARQRHVEVPRVDRFPRRTGLRRPRRDRRHARRCSATPTMMCSARRPWRAR